jgi:hypothetical protein
MGVGMPSIASLALAARVWAEATAGVVLSLSEGVAITLDGVESLREVMLSEELVAMDGSICSSSSRFTSSSLSWSIDETGLLGVVSFISVPVAAVTFLFGRDAIGLRVKLLLAFGFSDDKEVAI